MTLKDKAVQHASHYFDEGGFKKDLSELIAVKTESQNQKYNLKNYYKNNIIPMLTEMGFKCNIMKNSSPEANVFLFAERIENHNFKTILTYGHGDVVLGQDESWEDDLTPYKLIEKDGSFYGRGLGVLVALALSFSRLAGDFEDAPCWARARLVLPVGFVTGNSP